MGTKPETLMQLNYQESSFTQIHDLSIKKRFFS